jgi:hypothetical protein
MNPYKNFLEESTHAPSTSSLYNFIQLKFFKIKIHLLMHPHLVMSQTFIRSSDPGIGAQTWFSCVECVVSTEMLIAITGLHKYMLGSVQEEEIGETVLL